MSVEAAKYYTPGKIAKLCKVAPRTVTKWIDDGLLKGARIPGSKHRRVLGSVLSTFMKQHGISDATDEVKPEAA